MGTNYYVTDKENYCEHCERGSEQIHLGKSPAGWCFSLHIYPDKNINNLKDLIDFIKNKEIRNEYDEPIHLIDFIKEVTIRSGSNNIAPMDNMDIELKDGLYRHRISKFCIGHGEGTWDYLVGEFS